MHQVVGRFLIIMGIVFVVVGLLVFFRVNIPFLGRLPGDIRIERDNFRFYFPVTTCILISAVVTLILYLLRRR